MNKIKLALSKQRKEVPLDGAGIDMLSQLLADALEQAGTDRKDIIRLRLAVEEILGLWSSRAEKKTSCTFRCGTRLGRMYIEITAPGSRIDPDEAAADMAGRMLGRIGKTVLFRFLGIVFLLTAITAACLVWVFQPESGAASMGENAAAQIYSMILGIIPTNIITPFLEGNSLQIIFMAICTGLVLLVLGEKSSALRVLLGQVNAAVQFMMEIVSRYIALFVFVSLLSLMLSDALSNLGGVVKGLLSGIAACVVWPLLYALWASLRLKVSFPMILRKLLPTYLIALSTASSSAALSTNLETCERRLGISGRIVHFAVPLGQVMFKTGGAVGFFVLALGLAEFFGVAMPVSWVVTGVLTAGLLAIAAPPVPGGSLTCYTVLLTQLGIPEGAIGLAVAGNVLLDFFMTSCGISCLQSELMLSANKLGMLDRDRLEKE